MTRLSWGVMLLLCGCFEPVRMVSLGERTVDGGTDAGVTAPLDAGSDAGGEQFDAGFTSDAGALGVLTCEETKWCWQHPLPQGEPLNATYVVSASEAWAFGDRGAVLRASNGVWTALAPPTDFDLDTVAAATDRELWISGHRRVDFSTTEEALFRFDGTTWSRVSHGTQPIVSQISALNREAWVITSAMTTLEPRQLLRWNGTAFEPAPALPAGLQASSVCVRSADEVWVTVTDARNSFPFALYRWNGSAWQLQHQPDVSALRYASGVLCPAEGVAVAGLYAPQTSQYLVLELKNGVATTTPRSRFDLVGTPHGEAFVIQNTRAERWTPSGWVSAFSLPLGSSVFSSRFDFLQTEGVLVAQQPWAYRWDGAVFTTPTMQRSTLTHFLSPPALNSTDPIAAFGDGTFGLRQTDGSWSFSSVVTGSGEAFRPTGLFRLPSGDAFVVGNGVMRFDAATRTLTELSALAAPGYESFKSIDGLADGSRLWAVGSEAKVRVFDGSRWGPAPVALPTVVDGVTLSTLNLSRVDVRAADDVLILGDDPAGGRFVSVFFKWDGTSWATALSSGVTLNTFDRDTSGTIYVIDGANLKKRQWADPEWTVLGSYPGAPLRLKVYGPDEIELVAATDEGLSLFRWDSDRRDFEQRANALGSEAAVDIVPGQATAQGRETLWALGGWGSVWRWVPSSRP